MGQRKKITRDIRKYLEIDKNNNLWMQPKS